MAFPQSPLAISGELYINGAWTDVTSHIRGSGDVTIFRGRSSRDGRLTASTCDFILNNRDGHFSDRNPMSPYYGLLPRNVPCRIGVTDSNGMALNCGDYSNAQDRAETVDKAALDITGDIDIRIDIDPSSWAPSEPMMLASKYVTTGNQRSWYVRLNTDGTILIVWSSDGSASFAGFAFSASLASTVGRKAIRIQVDVNNGAGGYTVTFATADTIGGSYSALGTPAVTAGVTSIYASSAALSVGAAADGSTIIVGTRNFVGRYYGFELRNSAGTLVADADFNSQTAGDTQWSDGLGNTWDVYGKTAMLTTVDPRFSGELSSLPVQWDASGRDVFSPVTASGIIQRLTQGVKALRSPIYRNFKQRTLTGWWPGEDDSDSSVAGSAIAGSRAAYYVDVSPTSDSELLGSNGVLEFNSSDSYMSGTAKDTGSNTGSSQFLCYFRFPTVPVADVELVSVYMTGGSNVAKFAIVVSTATYKLNFYDANGAVLAASTTLFGSGAEPNQWMAMAVRMETSGGNISWEQEWYPIGGAVIYSTTGSFAGTVGRMKSFIIWDRTGRDGMRLAHLYLSQVVYDVNEYRFLGATNGYADDTAIARMERLCEEEGVTFLYRGESGDTELMGRQTASEFMDLIYECVDVDGGRLFEPRELTGLAYVTRNYMQNRIGVQLDYSTDLSPGLRPADDDLTIRNDVTVTRPGGASARAELSTGRMSTLPPSSGGGGRYDVSVPLNSNSDDRLQSLAEYQVQLGTVDDSRYAGILVNLARSALVSDVSTSRLVKRSDIGDNLALTNMPSFLPPDDVDSLIEGVREVIANSDRAREWSFLFNTSPYSPYRINDLTSSSTSVYIAGATNSSTNASVTSGALSFAVKTPNGALWRTSGIFPVDIMVGGERMTVSAISGASSPQTFTISARSVNGIVKAHNADVSVDVVKKFDATL